MCLVPQVAQNGDHICVLLGGSTPFVLREIDGQDEYKLIGEAYVHGIMDGEVVERAEVAGKEASKFRLR